MNIDPQILHKILVNQGQKYILKIYHDQVGMLGWFIQKSTYNIQKPKIISTHWKYKEAENAFVKMNIPDQKKKILTKLKIKGKYLNLYKGHLWKKYSNQNTHWWKNDFFIPRSEIRQNSPLLCFYLISFWRL